MRNLIIGSRGFIGSSLIEYLLNRNEEVIEFDIKRSPNEDARIAQINFNEFDNVYFLAWEVGGAKYLYSDESQFEQLNSNLKIMNNLMPQLRESNVKFLFISSQLAEDVDSVYGVTKRLGEVWTKLLPNGYFIRQWNVYGTIENESIRSHVISDFVIQAVKNKEIRMLTTGEEYRQFIHINDVCSAYHKVLNECMKGTYDVTSFEWVKLIDVANIIANITGALVIKGDKIGSTPNTPIKGKIHNWQPTITLEEGLLRMINETKNRL
jgi:nucleoside-diphosphate-sugar epimerase